VSKKRMQILLVLSVFVAMSVFVISPSFTNQALFDVPASSVISQDASLVGSVVTVGDFLLMYSLFGSTVTIMIWVTQHKRGR
jgi:hypothetical protein